MKKIVLISIINFSFLIINSASAQILCIYCYEQNDSISDNVNNMVLNGSFENHNCQPNIYSSSFCPVSQYYSCTVPDWTCTGGGFDTYVSIDDYTFTQTAEGNYAAYFGDGVSGKICSSSQFDTSCFAPTGCEMLNIPVGYPVADASLGGSLGVSLEQTVSGLAIGNTYVLEFWAGGEPQSHGWQNPGVFAVDLGFGYTYLRDKPTCPGCIGTTYIIIFNATATSHNIKFTNWGHSCSLCTELILDNVRLYTLAELNPIVPPCAGANVTAMFTAPNHICPGTCTNFNNLSVNATTFTWSFPGGNPAVSSDVNPANICYNSPGSYNVMLIASGASGSDTLSLPNYITVYPFPPAQGISQSGDTLFANQGATGYQWYHDGNILPGATDYLYVASEGGSYNVVATDINGCEVEAVVFDVVAGISRLAVSNGQLTIFPNPVHDKFTIHNSKVTSLTAVEISIYNALGVRVFNQESKDKLKEDIIDVSTLEKGVYYIEVNSDTKINRSKFIKQ
jgi:PKD repeat protein